MQDAAFRLPVDGGVELYVHRWEPGHPAKASVQVAHGMADHGARYARTAEYLTRAGYAVYVPDQRGHGKTASSPDDLGFFAEQHGFARVVEDQYALNQRIATEHPGAPIFALGHSFGSFVMQHYFFEHGTSIVGGVLSGTALQPAPLAAAGRALAMLERLRLGARGRSKLLDFAAFARFNLAFRPARTEFDWISSDPAEVDKYVADPFCGFKFTCQGWVDLYSGLIAAGRAENLARVPRPLPIYMFAGERDPVSQSGKDVRRLERAYRAVGVQDVSVRFYPGGRHEMLNERNRDEVHRDLIGWLDAVLARRDRA